MGAHIKIDNVSKSYGPVRSVRNVSLDLSPGEFLALLGPSGSGKTTTLMIVAGFEKPDTGRILIDGIDVTNLPPHKRSIGVVFQSYALFPHMSVHDNIAFPLRMRGLRAASIDKQVNDVLSLVDLTGYAARRPVQLSGGEQQRVALARALVFSPSLLLLDEPLGALDRQLRERMKIEFSKICDKLSTTMLYVTHDQEEAMVLADRIAVMNEGTIYQVDDPVTMYNRPKSRFVAGFLGDTNMIPLSSVKKDGGRVIGFCEEMGMEICASVPETEDALSISNGAEFEASIRLEKIRICTVNAGDRDEIVVPATIEEAHFMGAMSRYTLRVSEGFALYAISVNEALGREPSHKVGDAVFARVSPNDIHMISCE